ncbi:hypothetical protein F4778DRAFT_272472 [Xylariomycetidae sp. FL2044]|nr:hypothetical protein F4778DRAFT_272472 [Xylariomycetidae sp. FL2044]
MEKIANAPDHIVRATLIALCNSTAMQEQAEAYIDKMTALAAGPQRDATTHGSARNRKRKAASEINICVQCLEAFHADDNEPKACLYHDGDLDFDDDSPVWYDWDERCHGEMDCEETRQEYPEGFAWSCCDNIGTHKGCTRGPHEAMNGTRGRYAKRVSYTNGGEEEEDEEDDE